MKRWIGVVIVGILFGVSVPRSEAIFKIVGTQAACDTTFSGCNPIPLTLTTLCSVGCPFRSSFSFTDSTRFWGATGVGVGSCVTSTDSGATWVACTTQPFTTGANELYAGASDGSVIALSTTTGPTTCTIRRSINNATSWVDVFTELSNCNVNNFEGQYLYCLSNGSCEASLSIGGVGYHIIRSSNNGQTWVADAAVATGGCTQSAGSAWNGSGGIVSQEDAGCGLGAKSFLSTSDVWALSGFWAGTQGHCWGAVVYNGTGRSICQVAGASYTVRDSTGALVSTLTLPTADLAAGDEGGPAIAPFTNTMYVLATTASSGIGVYVSSDNLASFNLLGTIVSAGGLRGGNMFYTNACIYFTTGTILKFAKIC